MTIFGGDAFGRGLGRESEPPLMELASISKRLQRTPLSLPSFEDIVRRRPSVIPEEGSPGTKYGGTWI